MPDISMCKNNECDRRKQCYRYMAEPSQPYQCYADFKPEKLGDTYMCIHCIPLPEPPKDTE